MSASIFHLFLKACLYSSQIPQYLHLFFIYSSMPAYFLHWFPNACLLFFTDSSSLDSMLLLFATWCPKLKSRNDCPIRAYRFRLNHSLGKMQTCLEPTFGPLFWCFTSTDRGQFELIKIVCLSMSPSSLSASEKFWTSSGQVCKKWVERIQRNIVRDLSFFIQHRERAAELGPWICSPLMPWAVLYNNSQTTTTIYWKRLSLKLNT